MTIPVKMKQLSELENKAHIPVEMKKSLAYRTLTDEAKIILLLMMIKERGDNHAGSR